MDENERLVREHWEEVIDSNYGVDIVLGAERLRFPGPYDHWKLAADFTQARIEEVRQLEEEIALIGAVESSTSEFVKSIYVSHYLKRDTAKELPIWNRILSRLQGILAEKRWGMKEGA